MLNITESSNIKKFISYLEGINQIFKNSANNSEYTLHKETIYSFNKDRLTYIKATITYKKKDQFVKDYFKDLSLYINGIELYNFLKENKKNIKEIKETEDGLIIDTIIPELNYCIKKLVPKESNDILLYKQYKTEVIDNYIKGKEYIEYEVTDKEYEELTKLSFPKLFEIENIKLKVSRDVILGMKKASKLSFRIYETDREDVYIVNALLDNSGDKSNFISNNYFAILNY